MTIVTLKKYNYLIENSKEEFMRSYENKEELKREIKKSYEKYIVEFSDIPNKNKNKKNSEVDRTPAENLAYQVGWTTLLLQWENNYKLGIEVKTPSDYFKWNQLGELYQWFTNKADPGPAGTGHG